MSQPYYYHIFGTLPPNHLETRVAMIPVDQTNEAYRSNAVQDFGNIQFMFMVITQPKLIVNGRAVKVSEGIKVHMTYLVFRN